MHRLEQSVADKEELLQQVRAQQEKDKKKSEDDIEGLIEQASQYQNERDAAFKRSRQLQEHSDTLNTRNLDQEVSLRENEKVIKDLNKQLRESQEQIEELNRSNAEAAALSDASGESVSLSTHKRHLHRLETMYMQEKEAVGKLARETAEQMQLESERLQSECERLTTLYEDQTQHSAMLTAQNTSLQDNVLDLEQQMA